MYVNQKLTNPVDFDKNEPLMQWVLYRLVWGGGPFLLLQSGEARTGLGVGAIVVAAADISSLTSVNQGLDL